MFKFVSKWDDFFVAGTLQKITTIPEVLTMALRASRMSSRASGMSPRASKMRSRASKMRHQATKIYQNHRFFASRISIFLDLDIEKTWKTKMLKCKKTKQWHGGGLCAQRTGYNHITRCWPCT